MNEQPQDGAYHNNEMVDGEMKNEMVDCEMVDCEMKNEMVVGEMMKSSERMVLKNKQIHSILKNDK